MLDIAFSPPVARVRATIHNVPKEERQALVCDLGKIPGAGARFEMSTAIRLYIDRASSQTDPYALICRIIQKHGLLFKAKTEIENIWALTITIGPPIQSRARRGGVVKSLNEIPGVLDARWRDDTIYLKLECELNPFLRKRIETNLRACFV